MNRAYDQTGNTLVVYFIEVPMNKPAADEEDKTKLLAFSTPGDSRLLRTQRNTGAPQHAFAQLRHGFEDTIKTTRMLGRSFKPGEFDVICARGAEAKKHQGNITLRRKIREASDIYTKAPSKLYKSMVVSSILEWFHLKSPNGGFVKRMDDGTWYEVSNATAREKIGQALRDRNHTHYKSSNKAKRKRWNKIHKKQDGPITPGLYLSEDDLQRKLDYHRETIQCSAQVIENIYHAYGGLEAKDEQLLSFFNQHNKDLLETLKTDPPENDDSSGTSQDDATKRKAIDNDGDKSDQEDNKKEVDDMLDISSLHVN